MAMAKRRVVITGIGAVTPLGLDFVTTWDRLLSGISGVARIDRFDTSKHGAKIAAMVKDFDPLKFFKPNEARHLDTFVQYAMVAAMEAIRDSGMDFTREDPSRCGCIMATGIGGIQEIESQHIKMMERGPDRVRPFFIPKIMCNAISAQIAIKYGLKGPNFVTSSACASSIHAHGMALRLIQWGEADVMVTGGSEAATTALGLAGFSNMKALSTRNDEPEKASRPFDKDRDGFVMGEGAAVMVMEEMERARKRGARIYAEVKGFGMNDDAFHITAPDETGEGPAEAMRLALKDAGIAPVEVDYVNAHGTSTPKNDKIECLAIKMVFGDHARKLAISSSKSMIGHLLGGAAAVETAITAKSIYEGMIHGTLNHNEPDPECDLDFVPNEARKMAIRNAIKNSFGFGGHNGCLVLGKA